MLFKLTPKEQKLLLLLAFLLVLGVVLRFVLPAEKDFALQQGATDGTGMAGERMDQGGPTAVEAAGSGVSPEKHESEKMIVIHMAGAVVQPGIYHLPAGSRVYQLLDAAGGALDEGDLERVNLAQPLVDGQQVYLPRKGEEGHVLQAGGVAGASPLININTASRDQLESLPGIGAVKAGNIMSYREQHGPFQSIEELLEVSGIGAKTLEGLRDLITVW